MIERRFASPLWPVNTIRLCRTSPVCRETKSPDGRSNKRRRGFCARTFCENLNRIQRAKKYDISRVYQKRRIIRPVDAFLIFIAILRFNTNLVHCGDWWPTEKIRFIIQVGQNASGVHEITIYRRTLFSSIKNPR